MLACYRTQISRYRRSQPLYGKAPFWKKCCSYWAASNYHVRVGLRRPIILQEMLWSPGNMYTNIIYYQLKCSKYRVKLERLCFVVFFATIYPMYFLIHPRQEDNIDEMRINKTLVDFNCSFIAGQWDHGLVWAHWYRKRFFSYDVNVAFHVRFSSRVWPKVLIDLTFLIRSLLIITRN